MSLDVDLRRRLLTDMETETLNERLLLATQYACNQAGIKIPWGAAGRLVGDSVTEGAIVQHLAKLRNRLEEAGEDVPPVLRRGGGYRKNVDKVAKKKGKAKVPNKGRKSSSQSEDDDDYGSGSDKPSPKKEKAKETFKGHRKPRSVKTIPVKQENSDEEGLTLSNMARRQRRRVVSDDDSEYGKGKKRINGLTGQVIVAPYGRKSYDENDEDDGGDWEEVEYDDDDDGHHLDEGRKTVAAGAPFLEQEVDLEIDYNSEPPNPKSQIVKLPIGNGLKAKKVLRKCKRGGSSKSTNSGELLSPGSVAYRNDRRTRPEVQANLNRSLFDRHPGSNITGDTSESFSTFPMPSSISDHDLRRFGDVPYASGGMREMGRGTYPINVPYNDEIGFPNIDDVRQNDVAYPREYGSMTPAYGGLPVYDYTHQYGATSYGNPHYQGPANQLSRTGTSTKPDVYGHQASYNFQNYSDFQGKPMSSNDQSSPTMTASMFPTRVNRSPGYLEADESQIGGPYDMHTELHGGDGAQESCGDFEEVDRFDAFMDGLGYENHSEGEYFGLDKH